MIGHHSRLGDMMGQPEPIYAYTRANYSRYSSVHVRFCGSSKHSLLKRDAEHIEQYRIRFLEKSYYSKRRGRKGFAESLFSRS